MPPEEARELFLRLHRALNHSSRMGGFVNCWHHNEGEAAALWKIYAGDALAVQSTIGRLKQSFQNEQRPISIGQVRYVEDPERDMRDTVDMRSTLLTKRSVFDYEKEIRALFLEWPPVETAEDFDGLVIPPGHNIVVNLNILIEKVYKYGHGGKPVELSKMGNKPAFWRDPVSLTTPRR